MSDDNQIEIPPTFIALFVPPGRIKPTESREFIAARYEFCEDLANLMTEHARSMLFSLGVDESDVLERCHRGLLDAASGVSKPEAGWVVQRLAELLEWRFEGLAGA
ncbi:hypothetical protein BH11PSE8_BH11PSE8_17960 [soil metagenome]